MEESTVTASLVGALAMRPVWHPSGKVPERLSREDTKARSEQESPPRLSPLYATSQLERMNELKSSLNVPCGCARFRISGPKSSTLPFPTFASAATTPFSRYCCPSDQPLRNGVLLSNQPMGVTPAAAEFGPSLNTGLSSKNTFVYSLMPAAAGCRVSTRAARTEPGV